MPANYTCIYTSADRVYSKTGLTNAEVDLIKNDYILEEAESELQMLTGRKFTDGNIVTEFQSAPKKDALENKPITINLSNYPVQSITLFNILNTDGTVNKTYATLTTANITAGTFDTTDYWLEISEDPLTNNQYPTGKITLKTDSFNYGTNNIKVGYTYGYTSVPVPVKSLATCLAGIRAWVAFLGGCYNRLNSYSIPQQSVDKGDFYARGKQMIDQLTGEANQLLDRVGRKPRILAFSSGGTR